MDEQMMFITKKYPKIGKMHFLDIGEKAGKIQNKKVCIRFANADKYLRRAKKGNSLTSHLQFPVVA